MLKKLMKKIIKSMWFQKLVPHLVTIYVKILGRTLKYKIIKDDEYQCLLKEKKPLILASWHGTLIPPLFYLRDQEIYVMASYHSDGRFIGQILRNFGWQLISGSSGKSGLHGFLELLKRIREGKITALTPDGPTGPARVLKPGLLQAAKKTGVPIVPLGVAAFPKRNLSSWDAFLVPCLGAKAAIVFGKPFYVDSKADEAELARKKSELEQIFSNLEQLAENIVRE